MKNTKSEKSVLAFADALRTVVAEKQESEERLEFYRKNTTFPHGRKKTGRPLPRIEFEHVADPDRGWNRDTITYWLVLPLSENDIRRESDGKKPYSEWYVPVGQTRREGGNGSPPIYGGEVDTPFRDGAHATFDRVALGLPDLPIYGVCPDTNGKEVATLCILKNL